jgi:hypothetical protein
LLSSDDILKYLYTKEIVEFSACCKTIHYKCTRIRLENFEFGPIDFGEYIDNTQEGLYWGHDSYELKLE